MRVAGLLLAAGSGRRYGLPKALADTGEGPWVLNALTVLGACGPVFVVVGARGAEVAALLPTGVTVVSNPAHATGMSSSLRVGLAAVPDDADAVLVTLVDLPDVTRAVADRVLAAAGPVTSTPPTRSATVSTVLARASFAGRPGHPVLIGRDHLAAVVRELDTGDPDAGAGRYLADHGAALVDCSDLAAGRDVDLRSTH